MLLKTPTSQDIDKIIHFFEFIAKDQGTLLLIFLRKRHDEQNRQPLIIGTNLLITTDALDQMNTIDKPFPKKILGT